MNLAGLDLNLLVSLDALLQQRSVTRAAQQLGLSQPALSASLARLRRHFDDELLHRVGNSYRLTPLAVQLSGLVTAALTGVERVFAAQPTFEPASSSREYALLASDYVVVLLGDTVANILAAEAPGTRLRVVANTPAMVEQASESLLSHDLLLIPHGFVSELPHQDLYQDEWVCVVAAGSPVVERGLTVEDLRRLPWVLTYNGQTASTPAARQMRMLGIEPHAQVVTESFLTVPGLVAGSDRVALLQRRLVDLLPLNSGIRALPCPFQVSPMIEAMWWHPVYDEEPEHVWLRSVLRRAATRLLVPGTDAGDCDRL